MLWKHLGVMVFPKENIMTLTIRKFIPEPHVTQRLFADPRLAPLWTLLRVYVGYEWLMSGWGKVTHPAGVWVGEKAGVAVSGFLQARSPRLRESTPMCRAGTPGSCNMWLCPMQGCSRTSWPMAKCSWESP